MLKFADYGGVEADEYLNHICWVLKFFQKQRCFKCFMKMICNNIITQQDMINYQDQGITVFKDPDTPTENPDVACTTIYYALGYGNSTQPFVDIGNELFRKAAVYLCARCGRMTCEPGPCPPEEHFGHRIPFDDGEDVHISRVFNGVEIVSQRLVNYTCCGAVVEGSIGCSPLREHQFPSEPQEIISEMGFFNF